MARSRRLGANPAVRGRVRKRVREGKTDSVISSEVRDLWPRIPERVIERRIEEERNRQAAVDVIMGADKRLRTDVAGLLGCPPGTGRVRMSITVFWTDPNTGIEKRFGNTVQVPGSGRLGDILNAGIREVITSAKNKGYDPGKITSANSAGNSRYRIEYVECI